MTIEIGSCQECNHFPTQFVALPDGVFNLHLPAGAVDDCATASVREVVQKLAAAQVEVQGLRDRSARLERELNRACQQHENAARTSQELREKLGLADTLIAARHDHALAGGVHAGWNAGYVRGVADRHNELASVANIPQVPVPTDEILRDAERMRLAARAVLSASALARHHPEEWGPPEARRLTCSCGNPDPGHMDVRREPAESLPLHARREWMPDASDGHDFLLSSPCGVSCHPAPFAVSEAGCHWYRIADTDEHNLPVIARTADIPEWAAVRGRKDADSSWMYLPMRLTHYHPTEEWQRIEDFNEHRRGREGQS